MRVELRNRLLFGTIIAAAVVGGLISDLARGSHVAVLVLGVLGVALGSLEYARLARTLAAQIPVLPMVVTSVALVLEAALHDPAISSSLPGAAGRLAGFPVELVTIGLGLAWVVLEQMFRHGTERFFANVGAAMLGLVYLGVSFSLLMDLALLGAPGNPGRGTQLTLAFLATVKLGDVCAYFGGRAFGRHKLAPRISPGKTWEGFAASFVGAIGGAYMVCAISAATGAQQPFAGWWQPAVWGLVLGPLGVAGDLAESCMKRDAAVKDSGAAVPGFGGILDILDALILAAPVAYLLGVVLP
ncbi:MAG: phosphatidate cytidylyltransferase [Planctomycetes bacterium]|nr:phosphatidate cytidylyltransferase [Planctomycetota bacterium]